MSDSRGPIPRRLESDRSDHTSKSSNSRPFLGAGDPHGSCFPVYSALLAPFLVASRIHDERVAPYACTMHGAAGAGFLRVFLAPYRRDTLAINGNRAIPFAASSCQPHWQLPFAMKRLSTFVPIFSPLRCVLFSNTV